MITTLTKNELIKIPIYNTVLHEWHGRVIEDSGDKEYMDFIRKRDALLDPQQFKELKKEVWFGLEKPINFEKRIALTATKFTKACRVFTDNIIFLNADPYTWNKDGRYFPHLRNTFRFLRELAIQKSFDGGILVSVKNLERVYKNLSYMTYYIGSFNISFISENGKISGHLCDMGNPHILLFDETEDVLKIFYKAGFVNTDCKYTERVIGRKLQLDRD